MLYLSLQNIIREKLIFEVPPSSQTTDEEELAPCVSVSIVEPVDQDLAGENV